MFTCFFIDVDGDCSVFYHSFRFKYLDCDLQLNILIYLILIKNVMNFVDTLKSGWAKKRIGG